MCVCERVYADLLCVIPFENARQPHLLRLCFTLGIVLVAVVGVVIVRRQWELWAANKNIIVVQQAKQHSGLCVVCEE